jgi:hypothetical protein
MPAVLGATTPGPNLGWTTPGIVGKGEVLAGSAGTRRGSTLGPGLDIEAGVWLVGSTCFGSNAVLIR